MIMHYYNNPKIIVPQIISQPRFLKYFSSNSTNRPQIYKYLYFLQLPNIPGFISSGVYFLLMIIYGFPDVKQKQT